MRNLTKQDALDRMYQARTGSTADASIEYLEAMIHELWAWKVILEDRLRREYAKKAWEEETHTEWEELIPEKNLDGTS